MFKNDDAARFAFAMADTEHADAKTVLLSSIDPLLTDEGREAFQHLMKGLKPRSYGLALDTRTVLKTLHCAYENGKSAAELLAHFESPEKITISELILWRIRNRSYVPVNEMISARARQWYQAYMAQQRDAPIHDEDDEPDEPDDFYDEDSCCPTDEEIDRLAAGYHADLGADRAGPLRD